MIDCAHCHDWFFVLDSDMPRTRRFTRPHGKE
jgi:hypothetical protein